MPVRQAPAESPIDPELEGFEVQMPDVPVREAEAERGDLAKLNLEDRRRREAQIKELQDLLRRLEGTSYGSEGAQKYARSPSARKRQIQVRKEIDRLQKLTFRRGDRWEGPATPATLINMNPISLYLSGELQRWAVPAAGRGAQQDLILQFMGRRYKAAHITFRTPHVWLSHSGTQSDMIAGIDTPAMAANHIPPLGLAYQFYSHYVQGAADAQYMGGIVIFEGDIKMLDRDRLQRASGKVWVPKEEITLEGMGDVVYTVVEKPFKECMREAIEQQKKYAEMMIAEGHHLATSNSDIERRQLRQDHRIWHNFALDMGYIEKAYPWAAQRLIDQPIKERVRCPDCGTAQAEPDQYFCTNCNAPFDACRAFLAGKVVSPDRLAVYDPDSEEWAAIVKEANRRRAQVAILQGENTPPAAEKKDK